MNRGIVKKVGVLKIAGQSMEIDTIQAFPRQKIDLLGVKR